MNVGQRTCAALALAAALIGCGDDDGGLGGVDRGESDGGFGGETGSREMGIPDPGGQDASVVEVGADAGPVAPEPGALFADPAVGDDFAPPFELGGACVAAETNAFGTPLGCEDVGCATTAPACCIGRSDCCEAPQAAIDTVFGACDAGCPSLSAFGSPSPRYDEAFFPGGDGFADSGLVSETRFDLRDDRLSVRANFVPDDYGCTSESCLESVAIGLVRSAPSGDDVYLAPVVALALSGGRMRAAVGLRTIFDEPSMGGVWSLRVEPSGELGIFEGDALRAQFAGLLAPEQVRVVAFGHNANPPANARGAHLTELRVEQARCATTRGWNERTPIAFAQGGSEQTSSGATQPTTARDGEGLLHAAFLREGRLVLTRRADDRFASRWLRVDEAYEAIGGPFDDAELAYEDALVVYTVEAGSVHRSRPMRDGDNRQTLVERTLIAHDVPVHAISIAVRGVGERVAALVRSGGSVEALSHDGLAFVRHSTLPTTELGDALGSPELFIREGLYEAYVPYRRGTRWRLAHFVSQDFIYWNLADAAALQPMGADERFGPRAPDVQLIEGARAIELFYERFDGVDQTLGYARRNVTAGASF